MNVTILTASITRDALDSKGVIRDDAWGEQRQRYIDMCVAEARALYPDAEIDTAEGNGLESVRVSPDSVDEYDEAIEARDEIENALGDVYIAWCESIPEAAYE